MTCEEAIMSEDVYDYITDFPIENTGDLSPVFCYAQIEEKYNVAYVDSKVVPSLENTFWDYPNIPMLYGILDGEGAPGVYDFQPRSLQDSGILAMQQGSLRLTGRGVIMCYIDTGIDYRNPVFRTASGDTRILAIWDQTLSGGKKPEGFFYGTEFSREQINEALQSENPLEVVPHRDTSGHGTALASVGAGSRTESPGFLGAAPDSDIVVVKCKPAKQYLRDYYQVKDGVLAFEENDIMLAVEYCQRFAVLLERPIVICIGLGTSLGDHKGYDFLSEYLDRVAVKRSRGVVIGGGSEGDVAHHYTGNTADNRLVELYVGPNQPGFFLEVWGQLPDVLTFTLTSPGGESLPKVRVGDERTVTYGFVFEETIVSIDSTFIEPSSGEQLIRLRFVKPTQGIWSFQVESIGQSSNGTFDMWLTKEAFVEGEVAFLRPSPDTTITSPGYAINAITVAYFNSQGGALAPSSGRGYGRSGRRKPDLAAPGVQVSTIRGLLSGSGLAASLTAGAIALFFEWAVVNGNNPYVESREVKSFLLLGATREDRLTYPNREWGYGKLNLQKSFEILADS